MMQIKTRVNYYSFTHTEGTTVPFAAQRVSAIQARCCAINTADATRLLCPSAPSACAARLLPPDTARNSVNEACRPNSMTAVVNVPSVACRKISATAAEDVLKTLNQQLDGRSGKKTEGSTFFVTSLMIIP